MFTWLADKGGIIAVLATIFMFINLGSVCCALPLQRGGGLGPPDASINYRWIASVFGIIGTLIAMTNAWEYFIDWLNFLGIIIPPVGAVILADHMLPWTRHAGHDPFDLKGISVLRPAPFIAWACGSARRAVPELQRAGILNRDLRLPHRLCRVRDHRAFV